MCVYACVCVFVYVCVHACMSVCVYVCVRTCVHACVCARTCTCCLTQSQHTDTEPTSSSAGPVRPGAWQGNHWSIQFCDRNGSAGQDRIEPSVSRSLGHH